LRPCSLRIRSLLLAAGCIGGVAAGHATGRLTNELVFARLGLNTAAGQAVPDGMSKEQIQARMKLARHAALNEAQKEKLTPEVAQGIREAITAVMDQHIKLEDSPPKKSILQKIKERMLVLYSQARKHKKHRKQLVNC